jgi:pimeloyl-ACP methyl ester carboxylesterase
VRGSRRLAVMALAAAALLFPAAGARAAFPGPATSGDFAGLVTIPDGRHMYLECHGAGSPTVVFEAGLRGRGDFWDFSVWGPPGTGVFSRVAAITRACIYDRPGTMVGPNALSRSDPVPMPRTTGAIVTDLHDLLFAAGVPGPYVIAGGSTGGLIARQYASRYPLEVAGLVLVDAISERVQGLMKPAQYARFDQFYLQSPSADARKNPHLEMIDFYRSFAEMRRKRRPPRPIPMAVISSQYGLPPQPGVTDGFASLVNRVWRRAQGYLARLEPRVKRVIAKGSGHLVSINRPGLTTRMVARVVAAVRDGHRFLLPKKKHG